MDQDDERLDRLEELLRSLSVENKPRSVSELDGFVTGLLACPEMIPPSDWLLQVWGMSGSAQFPDLKAAAETIEAVMAHYNDVAAKMTTALQIEPIYETDLNSGETLWEPWVDGYSRAVALRADAWGALFERADEETQSSMIFLMALQDISTGNCKFSDDEIEQINIEAPDLIPNCVETILFKARPELVGKVPVNLQSEPCTAPPRPGRNDPCPCGCGRKYKQCCGRN